MPTYLNSRQRGILGLAISGLWGTILSVCGIHAQAQSQTYVSPHQTIENQAGLVKDGDETSMRALVDGVFNFPTAYPPIPADIQSIMKNRLVRAEMLYRRGQGPGVQEQNIVNLVNTMAQKLGAPDYTMTSANQVRHLRMQLAIAEPNFMGTGMTHSDASSDATVDPTMSPLQAAHLIGFLVTQKFIGAEFQVSPTNWDQTPHPTPMMQMPGSQQGRLTSNLKTTEMRGKFDQLSSSLTLQDGFDMANQLFLIVGIDQQGGKP